jgi:prefoldin beta subunit
MNEHERHTIEQNLHSLAVQKQTLHQQLMETDLALKELGTAKQAYRIVSGIMVQTPVNSLVEELNKKKEVSQARMQTIEKQEEKLRAKLQ